MTVQEHETICDGCSRTFPDANAKTCGACGCTFCEECIARHEQGCDQVAVAQEARK